MDIHQKISSIRKAILKIRSEHQSICLVPTMGNLHDGHLSLVRHAQTLADQVVVSLFVNPLQFGPGEDLDSYPSTFSEDCEKLTAAGVHHLFTPTADEMYPGSDKADCRHTEVVVPGLSRILCGESRPTHFTGVTTVISMLFNIIQPDSAVFGKKDFQQLAIIRKMARDLQMPIEIVGCPIVRENDNLAMSSRNNYLTPGERKIAPILDQTVRRAADDILNGNTDYTQVCINAINELTEAGFKSDYFSVRNALTLEVAQPSDTNLVILTAAWLGRPRLLDNIEITLK
ncbi:MAG: pantoate--beta-alanine ligase [Gammaproteobacteria bacterium]|nr:pantoate--beta-alanine ligase [Gammaproteobacteria bacterium]